VGTAVTGKLAALKKLRYVNSIFIIGIVIAFKAQIFTSVGFRVSLLLWQFAQEIEPSSRVMSSERELYGLIDSIYEAVLDSNLWPSVLLKFADVVGVAQIAMPSFDWRANIFNTIAPRFDPDLLASYRDYWAFHEPIVPRAARRPLGEIYSLDDLMPREEFAATPVFNEWWQRAGCGLAAIGTNLVAEDQFSALICLFNAPGKDEVTSKQARLFEAVLPHIGRAVRIYSQLRDLEIMHVARAERFETLPQAVLLADAWARVVLANSAAKIMLDARDGIFLSKGRLAANGISDALRKLVASCVQTSSVTCRPGGELKVPRVPPNLPLDVTVAPLRSKTRLSDVPWIGAGSPVAIVTVTDSDLDRQNREKNLRRNFGLTPAEATFAAEILKGDGRKAAAQRCGVSDQTAKTYLSKIFWKTGTHRQAELVRVLLGAAATPDGEA
jgi:DNA-binding CsgD family transcriptional regulator